LRQLSVFLKLSEGSLELLGLATGCFLKCRDQEFILRSPRDCTRLRVTAISRAWMTGIAGGE
jgi:hypothetical protein